SDLDLGARRPSGRRTRDTRRAPGRGRALLRPVVAGDGGRRRHRRRQGHRDRHRRKELDAMTELSRWQFATTSIYHFLFVPVTIGLAFLVALLQTAWHRSLRWGGDPVYRRLTKFFGTLLLINVAVGVVTGLIQEFEFGMNWS